MKIALCFLISYSHELNKEEVWKTWIDDNSDLFTIYFHYKNYNLIKSSWIKKHAIPPTIIADTSYYFVVPAYMSILNFAFQNKDNKWFCLLTDSCVPIVSPAYFREQFMKHYRQSILQWEPAYWNIYYHSRANLKMLHKEFHLSNAPWFILSRDHVNKILYFLVKQNQLYKTICEGGLANESIFAIILKSYKELDDPNKVINKMSTLTDWKHMSSPTSPYVFDSGSQQEMKQINELIQENEHGLFLRKVSKQFPDNLLYNIIYKKDIIRYKKNIVYYQKDKDLHYKNKNNVAWVHGIFIYTIILLLFFYVWVL